MRYRRPKTLYQIVGYDAAWRPHICPRTGEGLLHAPAPAPLALEEAVIDERIATEPLTADGEPLH